MSPSKLAPPSAIWRVLPFILCMALPSAARGDWAWEAVPKLTNEIAYDDNILYEGESGLEYQLSPAIQLSGRDRRTGANLSARLAIFRYLTDSGANSDFNRTNQYYATDVLHQAMRRLNVGAFASLSITDSTTQAIEEAGMAADDSRVHAFTIGGFANWELDRLSKLNLSYELDSYIYESGEFSDSLRHTVSLGLSRELDARTSGSVTTSYENYRFNIGENDTAASHTGALYFGLGHAFSSRMQAEASLGGGVAHSDLSEDSSYNALGSASLSYSWRKAEARLGLSRSYERSVLDQVLLVDAATLGASYRPLTDLTLSAGAVYRQSQGTGSDDTRISDYFSIYESLGYALSQNWTLSLSHTYSHVDSSSENQENNRFMLSIAWAKAFPL